MCSLSSYSFLYASHSNESGIMDAVYFAPTPLPLFFIPCVFFFCIFGCCVFPLFVLYFFASGRVFLCERKETGESSPFSRVALHTPAEMGFDFHLHQPPCDVSFLAVIDGPVLYNADDAASGNIKDATIRQIGWHVLHLPDEWFFSGKARELTERVCHTMQCTIQYLLYRQNKLSEEMEIERLKTQEIREERNAAFEELVELREVLALMKKRYGEDGRRAAATPDCRAHTPGCSFTCTLCGNLYPSSSSLESHVVKRHHRGKRYASIASASMAVHNQMEMAATGSPETCALVRELASLRADVSSLRASVTESQQTGKQLEGKNSTFSPINVVALPAPHLPDLLHTMHDGVYSSQQQRQEGMIKLMEEELRMTKSRLAYMEQALWCQDKLKKKRKKEGREMREEVFAPNSNGSLQQVNTFLASTTRENFQNFPYTPGKSLSNVSYSDRSTAKHRKKTMKECDISQTLAPTPVEASRVVSVEDSLTLMQLEGSSGMLHGPHRPEGRKGCVQSSLPDVISEKGKYDSSKSLFDTEASAYGQLDMPASQKTAIVPVTRESGEPPKKDTFVASPEIYSNVNIDNHVIDEDDKINVKEYQSVSQSVTEETASIEAEDVDPRISATENKCYRSKADLSTTDSKRMTDGALLNVVSHPSFLTNKSSLTSVSKKSVTLRSNPESSLLRSSAVPTYYSLEGYLEVPAEEEPRSDHVALLSTTRNSYVSSEGTRSLESHLGATGGQDPTRQYISKVESKLNLPEKVPGKERVKKRKISFFSKLFGKHKK